VLDKQKVQDKLRESWSERHVALIPDVTLDHMKGT
jgi:hypothetical protein